MDVRQLPRLVEFAPYIAAPDVRRNVLNAVTDLTNLLPLLRGLHSQAIHGDCHGGNLLVNSALEVCGILDFGDMIHAPIILEPAVALAELPSGGADRSLSEALIAGYGSLQELSAADVAVLYDLIAARHATTLLLHAWRRRHDPSGAHLLDQAAAAAATALDELGSVGRESLTRAWHQVTRTDPGGGPLRVDLGRRHRLLGAGAELFYEQPCT